MAKPPAVIDFSPEAIQKAIVSQTVQHPVLLGPTVFGAVALAAGMLIEFSLAPVAVIAGGVAVVWGVGGGIVQYCFRYDSQVASYLRNLSQATHERASELAKHLEEEFDELGYERGKQQIASLKEHMAAIADVLEAKFDKDDASYQQFYGSAESLYIRTLDLLHDTASQLRANSTYDPAVERQTRKGRTNESINQQRRLHEEGTARLETMSESVDSAIAGLADLTHHVARIQSATSETHKEFVQRVRDIASRASLYVKETI